MRKMIAAALLLSGCTTVGEMRAHEPKATHLSARSMPALEQCIGERLSWISPPSVLRGETETSIAFGYRGTTDALVLLRPEGSAVRVEVRTMLPYKGSLRRGIETCASS